jgi:hypothetical protein
LVSSRKEKFIGYIGKNGQSAPEYEYNAFREEMSHGEYAKLWRNLHDSGPMDEKDMNVYPIAPFYCPH